MAEPGAPPRLTPYALSLGIRVEAGGDASGSGAPLLALDFADEVQGRPGAYHGGATGGLLETAGYTALWAELARIGRSAELKPITITVQYLAAGKDRTSFAQGRVTKLGRRSANVTVEAWQDDRARPIATAVMNIFLGPPPAG